MTNIKPNDYQVYEILAEVDKIVDFNNKVEHLKTKFSGHIPLQRILKMNFCSTIVSMLPPGTPPFNREEADGPQPAALWSYLQQFPVIVRSAQSIKMRPMQIERVFIEMLEAIDVEEADVLCLAKDRKLTSKFPTITSDLVKAAFPSLIAEVSAAVEEIELTDEEKAERMLDEAKSIKDKVKELNAKAKELTNEAKKLVQGA